MPANYLDLANKMLGAAAAIVKVLPVVGGAGDLLEAAQKIVTAAEVRALEIHLMYHDIH
jgi:acyl CoA:acetate/3-ketoacid CoA transferase beta subunit